MPPTTLERSGSERRGGAVSPSLLRREGRVRGGALFNGKEGRGDFRKKSSMEN